jgi:hypothetical protein
MNPSPSPCHLPVGEGALRARALELDILRTGLNPALDLTLNPSTTLTKSNGVGMFSLEKLKVYD